jgi:putative tryptophan/tyrosine transport system substrate-binding protein
MKRREFITLLGGAAAWPHAARAQQPAMPVVGFLHSLSPNAVEHQVVGFRQGVNEAGFIEGVTLAVEYRWAEGHPERLPALARELVNRSVAVIVANNASMPVAKAATSTIPIVFSSGGDPIETGLVTSLSRPGGNITGVSFTTGALEPKRLELLSDLVPRSAVIAVLLDESDLLFENTLRSMEGAARGTGRQILIVKAGAEDEINAAFATAVRAGAGALQIGPGAYFTSRRRQLAALAIRHALPTIHSLREYVMAGGLMSYGASDMDAYRRVGVYVGRILKGAKPGDLPVEMPSKYELAINLATAKALGLTVPVSLLSRADELIE